LAAVKKHTIAEKPSRLRMASTRGLRTASPLPPTRAKAKASGTEMQARQNTTSIARSSSRATLAAATITVKKAPASIM
jgi:hypothetical protein